SLFFLFHSAASHRLPLHSFPTRRSSDLGHCPLVAQTSGFLVGALGRRDSREIVGFRRGPRGAGADRDHHQGEDDLFHDVWSHGRDRKSTRLNSSHVSISYAVFCLKKKKK